MKQLISVIINVYNGEKYIKKCLDSVINQTYDNIEILVVDDCSKDNTLNIINSYSDKRIRLLKNKKNMGLSLSRNVGIDNAKGKYLYFVDVDDYIEKDTIEYLYNLIKKYNVKIATCNTLNIYNYDFKLKNESEKIYIKEPKEMIRNILLYINNDGTTWNKLIDRELFNEIRFEDRIVNDVVVTYKLYMSVDKIVYSNQIKYYYLKHSDSIVGRRDKKRSIDLYKASIERYYNIKKVYPDFIENDTGMLLIIYNLYYFDYKKISDFFKEEKIKKVYNKIFSIKALKVNMRFNDKLKLFTFRISPKLSKVITRIYVFFHHIK